MLEEVGAPGATTQGDVAMQPGVLGDTVKRDPLKNIKKALKKKKKLISFKEWINNNIHQDNEGE